jgi:hypothetical protein
MRTSAPVRPGGIAMAWPSRLLCTYTLLVLVLVCVPARADGQAVSQGEGHCNDSGR